MNAGYIVYWSVLVLAVMLIVLTVLTVFRNRVSGATRVASIISAFIPGSMLIWPDWPGRIGYEWLWYVDIGGLFAVTAAALGERASWRAHKLVVILAFANVLLPILYVAGCILYIARDLGATS